MCTAPLRLNVVGISHMPVVYNVIIEDNVIRPLAAEYSDLFFGMCMTILYDTEQQ